MGNTEALQVLTEVMEEFSPLTRSFIKTADESFVGE